MTNKKLNHNKLFIVLPFVCLTVVFCIYHLILNTNFGDDFIYFSKMLDQFTLPQYLNFRYNQWTSRLVIETILVYLSRWSPWIWKLLDVAVFVLASYSITVIVDFKNKVIGNWLIVCLTIMYPFIQMNSAGWIATTINYIWPLAFGLYVLTIIKRIFDGQKLSWYHYVLNILALFYAGNQEQMVAILVVLFIVFTCYSFFANKFNPILAVDLIISMAGLAFLFICPGNDIRTTAEITRWYPDFEMLSIIDKVNLGFVETVNVLYTKTSFLLIMLCIIIVVLVFTKYNNVSARICSLMPLCISLFFCYGNFLLGDIHPRLDQFTQIPKFITTENYYHPSLYIPLFLSILLIGLLFVNIYLIMGHNLKFVVCSLVLGAGFVSRIIMGLSPTIYASSSRTAIFMFYSFIIVAGILLKDNIVKINKKVMYLTGGFVVAFAIASFADNINQLIKML